jgi:Phosphorylase superfamily
VVLTNAAGGIRPGLAVGQPVLISDHLNLTGKSPLTGPAPSVGPRFTDLTGLYSPRLRALAREADPTLAEGVYAMLPGPHYETPAEITMLGRLGADLVGMSTVLEAIAARQLGAEVLGISLVTNLAAGLAGHGLSHAEVVEAGRAAASRMGALLAGILPRVLGQRVAREQRVVVRVVQRIGVHHGGGQVGQGVDQPVLGGDRDRVRLDHRTMRIDQDRAFGTEAAAGPDPVPGDEFVAREAEGGRDGHGGQVGDRPRVRQPLPGGDGGHGGRNRDHGDDGQAGQVLGPAVAVGVPAVRAAPGEHEGQPEREGGQRVRRVVQRVHEQGDRAGQGDHHRLRARRRGQPGQREPQRPPAGRGLQCRVAPESPVVVRVRPDRVRDAAAHPRPVRPGGHTAMVLAVHAFSMAGNRHCSISTPALPLLLQLAGRGGERAPRPVR